jgi:hypothetical protein
MRAGGRLLRIASRFESLAQWRSAVVEPPAAPVSTAVGRRLDQPHDDGRQERQGSQRRPKTRISRLGYLASGPSRALVAFPVALPNPSVSPCSGAVAVRHIATSQNSVAIPFKLARVASFGCLTFHIMDDEMLSAGATGTDEN